MKIVAYKLGNVARLIKFPTTASENSLSEYDRLWIIASELKQENADLHRLLDLRDEDYFAFCESGIIKEREHDNNHL